MPRIPPSDGERLWQRDVGNALPSLAMAYRVGGGAAYRDFAIAQASEAMGYRDWGADGMDGTDLAAAHLMFGMAMVVDWLDAEIAAPLRGEMLETLRRKGSLMLAAAHTTDGPVGYWRETWLQNHLWVNMTGLLAAGIQVERIDPEAARIMTSTALDRMTRVFSALPSDGSSQEGPGYWEYGTEYLLKFHQLAAEVLGTALQSPWLQKAAAYRAAMTLPAESWTRDMSMLDPADSPRAPWYGPEHILRRLAALNDDKAAQNLAERLEEASAVFPSAPWLNFIWYAPNIKTEAAATLPTFHHFEDLDLIVARSDWSGQESVALMRAGPPLGKKAQSAGYDHDVGAGHVHPDVNHITLFGGGRFLLLDDGYAATKQTNQHNTLLVNGVGQTGSGQHWTAFPQFPLPAPQPAIAAVETHGHYDYWVGDGAAAYPAPARLLRFTRHVVFLKPDLLVVIDELAAAASSEFTLLWHPGIKLAETGPSSYAGQEGDTCFAVQFVLPATAMLSANRRSFEVGGKGTVTMDEIAVRVVADSADCAAVFSWARHGSRPAPSTVTSAGDIWTIHRGPLTLDLSLSRRRVTLPGNVTGTP